MSIIHNYSNFCSLAMIYPLCSPCGRARDSHARPLSYTWSNFTTRLNPFSFAAAIALPYFPPSILGSAPCFNSISTYALWWQAAACNAVPYSPPTAFTFAPLSRRHGITSGSQLLEQGKACNANPYCPPGWLMSAPCSSNAVQYVKKQQYIDLYIKLLSKFSSLKTT